MGSTVWRHRTTVVVLLFPCVLMSCVRMWMDTQTFGMSTLVYTHRNRNTHYAGKWFDFLCVRTEERVQPLLYLWISKSYQLSSTDSHLTTSLRTLNEVAADKIRDCLDDYNNRPSHSIPFMPVVANTSPLTASTVRLCAFYICRLIGKPTAVLLLQELSLCKQTCSISSMTLQYLHVHTLTPHTLKPVLVSHNTDTPIYVLPLDLVLSVITNKSD